MRNVDPQKTGTSILRAAAVDLGTVGSTSTVRHYLRGDSKKKSLNELYRLTSCKNFLKESLGTRPRRPPK